MSRTKRSPFSKYVHSLRVHTAVLSVTPQSEDRREAPSSSCGPKITNKTKPRKTAGKTNPNTDWKSIPRNPEPEKDLTSLWPQNPLENQMF